MKVPVPVPLVVWLPVIVGLCDVLQHTPLAVTGEQASDETEPPQVAVEVVILETSDVLTIANVGDVTLTVNVAVAVHP